MIFSFAAAEQYSNTVQLPEVEIPKSLSISMEYEQPLHFGDIVTLIATLQGYDNIDYTIQWQQSPDNITWYDIAGANGLTYSITITTDNFEDYWRFCVIYYEE